MTTSALEHQADAAARAGEHLRARALLDEATQNAPDNFTLWLKLTAMAQATGAPVQALDALDRALSLRPLDFTALLMRARLLDTQGDTARAGQAYGRALAQAPDPMPPQLQPAIGIAQSRYRAWQEAQAAQLRAVVPQRSPQLDRMIDCALRLAEPDRTGPTHYCYPGLPEIGFYDRARFAWLDALEAQTEAIAAEYVAVAAAREAEREAYIQYPATVPLDQWRALNHNPDWTAIHLLRRGQPVAANVRHCPRTLAALRDVPMPDVPRIGPNAMFSLLAPHTHIPPHTGIANTRLVCHLPLVVPGGCWFRVGDERREWVHGQGWVFDDTVEHEAMNPSDALRVVLIVDIWHPDLPEAERAGVGAIMQAGGQVHDL